MLLYCLILAAANFLSIKKIDIPKKLRKSYGDYTASIKVYQSSSFEKRIRHLGKMTDSKW